VVGKGCQSRRRARSPAYNASSSSSSSPSSESSEEKWFDPFPGESNANHPSAQYTVLHHDLKIPQKLITQPTSVVVPISRNKLAALEREFGDGYREYLDGFTITDPKKTRDGALGAGSYGSVFALERRGKMPRIIKFNELTRTNEVAFNADVKNNIFLTERGSQLSPAIHAHGKYRHGNKTFGILTTDKISMTLSDFLKKYKLDKNYMELIYENFRTFFNRLCRYKMIHGDMHFENIGVVFDYKGIMSFQLIDWGLGEMSQTCNPCADITQMMRCLYMDIDDKTIVRSNIPDIIFVLDELWTYYGCEKYEKHAGRRKRETQGYWDKLYDYFG